jgi:energy-coupling factor transporter ATP-binding protein EcfA2
MKISSISISNYRAFFNEKGSEFDKHNILLPKGENLFIYGENGSGKSSLYRGLRDLFMSSTDSECSIPRNVFSRSLELFEEPFVKLVFTHENDEPISWKFSCDPHLTNTRDGGENIDLLKSVVRARGFMTYRDLLRIHFVNNPEVNLFEFLFGKDGLLSDLQNPAFSRPETNLKMEELLSAVRRAPDEVNQQDFVNGVREIMNGVNTTLNAMLKYFDESLGITFSTLTRESLSSAQPELRAEVKYFDIELGAESENYHHFLNEARLSALAICIFLSANLSVPAGRFQMLFLDDIFTGLDTSNRYPLLDILTASDIGQTGTTFTRHQIFLTTYDRQWYELARNSLGQSNWIFSEMYVDKHSEKFEQPAILPAVGDYEKAWHYFKTKQYPACANYQRKICENLIKKFLPENLKFDHLPNGDIVPVTKLSVFIDKFKSYMGENGLSFEPFLKLKNSLRIVMNPLSHDDSESPVFRREIVDVFKIIDELRDLSNEIVVESGQKIKMKKNNALDGIERIYVSVITTPVRVIKHRHTKVISKFSILPLTQKDGEKQKEFISYGGSFEEVYGRFCYSLGIEKAEVPFDDFTLGGKPFKDLFI